MLHIQESFAHNSNLLMAPPITIMVQPQPSCSSRSNKVIEQLGSKLDSVHRDLAATRLQVKKKIKKSRNIQNSLSVNH